MKGLLFILFLAALSYAASDCEHTCCSQYSGSWDDDFDDCKHPKDGFDTCVSDCEARVWAARPQGPVVDPENTYTCKVGAILLSLVGGAAFLKARPNHHFPME